MRSDEFSFPALFQVNTRVHLNKLSQTLGRRATLDDFPDEELDQYKARGFQWIWLLSVWQTGTKGRDISRSNPGWKDEFAHTLPDLKEEDIEGSGFAIVRYSVHGDLGGDEALGRLRERLRVRGLKLMLDFVPNHSAIDHPWVEQHPDYYIEGNEELIANQPANYIRLKTNRGVRILAHGRDPFFPGWVDTLQLNYANLALQNEMIKILIKIAGQCDGVRCDMAMLVLPDIFEKTWGQPSASFWPRATTEVHQDHPAFVFMAEVYWDLEWTLQQQGFRYTYDKRLYDRLKEGNPKAVREHFLAEFDYQNRSARFLENHDEPRAAREFPDGKHQVAAVLTFFSPGLRFFHEGQLEGKMIRISPHLIRGPEEPINIHLAGFYESVLATLKNPIFHNGTWRLLEAASIDPNNTSNQNYVAFSWLGPAGEKALIVVNYATGRSQCFLKIPFDDLRGARWNLFDQLSETKYTRDGTELSNRGLFLDEPGWKPYIFLLEKAGEA